jgi:hypothetical protein
MIIFLGNSVALDNGDIEKKDVNDDKYSAERNNSHTFIIDDSLIDQGNNTILLVFNQTLSLNIKCLRPKMIYPFESTSITFIDRNEKVNSLRFAFYYKVNYGWDKHHRERYADLDLVSLQLEINCELYNLEKASQIGRIYSNSSGIIKFGFKNRLLGGLEIGNVKLEIYGIYNCLKYDMEGEKFYLLSCNKATCYFEIFQYQ